MLGLKILKRGVHTATLHLHEPFMTPDMQSGVSWDVEQLGLRDVRVCPDRVLKTDCVVH